MRRLLCLTALLATSAISAPAKSAADPNEWVPNDKMVATVDAAATTFILPAEFGQLGSYYRFYWGTVVSGRRVIQGVLLSKQLSDIIQRASASSRPLAGSDQTHIIAEADAPGIADGGCMIVYISYDIELGKVTDERCNFELPPPPQR